METFLFGTTIVALAIALVMSIVAAKLSREQRRRSSARVAALTAAAGISAAEASLSDEEPRRAPWAKSAAPARPIGFDVRESRASIAVDVPQSQAVIGTVELPLQQGFLSAPATPRTSSGGQKFLAVAAAVLFVVLATGFIWQWSNTREASASAAVVSGEPLELLSLSHDRQSSKLAVSGLVRNPVSSKPVDHLNAVVFLFDSQGTFVSSGKAPVDFVKLSSGDESPFVVTMEAPSSVARYRVSFRTDDGIMPHIDRRGQAPVADGAVK